MSACSVHFVPMILLPIAFVTFGAWWVIHHVLCRFRTMSSPSPATVRNVNDSPEEPLLDVAVPPEGASNQMGPEEPEIGATRSFAGSRAIVKLRRWLPALVTIVRGADDRAIWGLSGLAEHTVPASKFKYQ